MLTGFQTNIHSFSFPHKTTLFLLKCNNFITNDNNKWYWKSTPSQVCKKNLKNSMKEL